ncbi:MAG: hypothetical protein CMH98_03715 [Oceanospirillaceae bacterium]|nr:hypothetical protein [Oceanospirillaceae bacterium]
MTNTVNVRPIRSEDDYEAALERVAELMEAEPAPGTREFDELDILSLMVEAYEETEHPIDMPDPISQIEFRLEQQQMTLSDISSCFDGELEAVAIMNRVIPMTMPIAKKLSALLGIPQQNLLIDYELNAESLGQLSPFSESSNLYSATGCFSSIKYEISLEQAALDLELTFSADRTMHNTHAYLASLTARKAFQEPPAIKAHIEYLGEKKPV